MLLEDLTVILKVAEFRSITAAAESLDMRTATASAAIKRVEKSLGVELFIRTTRQLRLSSAGERYIPHCQQALGMLENARQSMLEELDIVDGELRISLPSDLGRNVILPWLDEFTEQHPNVSLKLNISDSNIDFYRDSVDLALRYGSPTDSSLYGFKICDVPGILCASPAYVEQHEIPEHPQALATHNGLFYQLHDIIYDVWSFTKGSETLKVKMTGNRASNDGEVVRRWCVAGKGVAVKSSLDIGEDLLEGRLTPILPGYLARQSELWIVCPSRQSITPAVRLLRDFMRVKCKELLSQLVDKQFLPSNVLSQ